MGGSEIEILFFAGIAAFVGYRLFITLGRRTGNDRQPFDPFKRRETVERPRSSSSDDNVVPLPLPRAREAVQPQAADNLLSKVAPGSVLANGLTAIREQDARFDADAFVEGAKAAHELIVKAFAEGDRAALKPLLASDVFSSFEGAMQVREKHGQIVDFAFVSLKETKLEVAALRGRFFAEVTVRFVSELISATRDAAGSVIDGAAGVVREVTDVWTFSRDTRSADRNWKVVATA